MGTIGADLRQAREAAGISRQQLSARTKIRPSLLEAIEQDDFGQLPAGLLGRGHLRAYAQEVHLDPDRIVQRFRNEYLTEPPPAAEPPAPQPLAIPPRQPFPVRALVVSVLVVAALTLVAQRYSRQTQENSEADAIGTAGRQPSETADTTAPSTPAVSAAVPAAATVTPGASGDRLAVELSPTTTVWVEARADGHRVIYSLVRAGDRPVVQAHNEIQLRLGDAGAVQYSINGKRGRAFGRPGEVRNVEITRENYETFQE